MDAANWVQDYFAAGAKVDGLWSMYIMVQLGILWFIFLVHRPLLLTERLIALGANGLFLFANGRTLMHSYQVTEALRSDLVNNFKAGLANTPELLHMLSAASYADRDDMIFWTHGATGALAALLLAFRNIMVRYYASRYPEHALAASRANGG
jgi:hypothetical protein